LKHVTRFEGCSLTLFFPDRTEIIAELSDAKWIEQDGETGATHVLSGLASDGSVEFIERALAQGVDTVAFDFETPEEMFQGTAVLDRPIERREPGTTEIVVETHEAPQAVQSGLAQRSRML
jgi:hypothetical protein